MTVACYGQPGKPGCTPYLVSLSISFFNIASSYAVHSRERNGLDIIVFGRQWLMKLQIIHLSK